MIKDLKTLFPKASADFIAANPHLTANLAPPVAPSTANTPRRGVMNRSEREFSFILEAQKRKGDILRWEFEGITLRWNGIKFTPDFVVFPSALAVSGQIKFVEIKGPFCKGKFERAIERFRHARTYYGDRFIFELHQRTRDGWRQLI